LRRRWKIALLPRFRRTRAGAPSALIWRRKFAFPGEMHQARASRVAGAIGSVFSKQNVVKDRFTDACTHGGIGATAGAGGHVKPVHPHGPPVRPGCSTIDKTQTRDAQ
jgi:hypothetical protein